MLSSLSALVLGIVEGFTEFLPISSTAHLALVADVLKISQTDFAKTFEIAIQSGAILAVVVLYFKKFLDWDVLKRIAVAFIPTGILGLIFYTMVKTYLVGNTVVVLWALGIGGAFLVLFEYMHDGRGDSGDIRNIGYGQAAIIGLCQSVAMIPGVSRSAATIVGGMLLGIGRKTIVEFSFLLAVPTMLAATGLDLVKSYGEFSLSQAEVLALGFAASFVMAMVSIKFLLNYIQKHTFIAFGIYRIVVVILFVLAVAMNIVSLTQ